MGSPRITEHHDLITIQRAAGMAGVTRPTITARILDGTFAAERIGQWLFLHRLEVEAFAKARASANNPTSGDKR